MAYFFYSIKICVVKEVLTVDDLLRIVEKPHNNFLSHSLIKDFNIYQ